MSGRCFWMGVSVSLILAFCVCAEEYKLQYESRDLRREGLFTPGQYLSVSTRSEERLSDKPRYQSKTPLYAVARFGREGDTRYTIVLDESQGTGRGYDTLYVDRNNNENLADDPKIEGRISRRGSSSTTGTFESVEVMINYGDRTVPHQFQLEYYQYGQTRIQPGARNVPNFRLMLYTGGYYTGNVSFGGSERRLALLDFNGNGLFNEYFEPSPVGPSGRLYAMGDQVLIDVNGDGRFSPGTDSDELYPCARCFRVDGEWYSLDISDCGSEVDVQRPDLKLGTIKIPAEASSCSLMLACSEGILKVQTGQEVRVPVDTYQVYYHSMEITHSSGRWRYDAYGSTAGKKFRVAEGSSVTVEFGAPLLVNVRSETRPGGGNRARAGGTVNISLELSGQGGEVYTNISRNNGRPPAPTFKALDEKGNVVAKGDFEYG